VVVAIINAQASLLLLSCHCCPRCNGVAVINAQASLQSRHLCHCCNKVVAFVTTALLPTSSWCCCPCKDGVIAIADAQASLPLSRWRCHTCCAGTIANIALALSHLLCQHCCHYSADLFALTLHGRRHGLCTGIVAPVELACLRYGVWV
jgi:hypothetical protein